MNISREIEQQGTLTSSVKFETFFAFAWFEVSSNQTEGDMKDSIHNRQACEETDVTKKK